MASVEQSPKVGEHDWGRIEVEGFGSFRDVKLWPGGAREWDWTETGTRHDPGIQPSDVEELLESSPAVIVLSRGRELRLKTCPETLAVLAGRGIEVIHDETSVAIDAYNRFVESGIRVASLIHSTC